MPTYITIHRGNSISTARLVAVSCSPTLVQDVAQRMLSEPHHRVSDDPALAPIDEGRAEALRRLAAGSAQ